MKTDKRQLSLLFERSEIDWSAIEDVYNDLAAQMVMNNDPAWRAIREQPLSREGMFDLLFKEALKRLENILETEGIPGIERRRRKGENVNETH